MIFQSEKYCDLSSLTYFVLHVYQYFASILSFAMKINCSFSRLMLCRSCATPKSRHSNLRNNFALNSYHSRLKMPSDVFLLDKPRKIWFRSSKNDVEYSLKKAIKMWLWVIIHEGSGVGLCFHHETPKWD